MQRSAQPEHGKNLSTCENQTDAISKVWESFMLIDQTIHMLTTSYNWYYLPSLTHTV